MSEEYFNILDKINIISEQLLRMGIQKSVADSLPKLL